MGPEAVAGGGGGDGIPPKSLVGPPLVTIMKVEGAVLVLHLCYVVEHWQ